MDPRSSAWGAITRGSLSDGQLSAARELNGSQSAAMLPMATPARGSDRDRTPGRQGPQVSGRIIPELVVDADHGGGAHDGSRPTSALESARRGGGSLADVRRESRRQSRAMIEAENSSRASEGLSRDESLGRESSWGREGRWGRAIGSSGGIPAAHSDASPMMLGHRIGNRPMAPALGISMGLTPTNSHASPTANSAALPVGSSGSNSAYNHISSVGSPFGPSDRPQRAPGRGHSFALHSNTPPAPSHQPRSAIPASGFNSGGVSMVSRASSTPVRLPVTGALPPVRVSRDVSPLLHPSSSVGRAGISGPGHETATLGAGGRSRGNPLSGAASGTTPQRGGFLRHGSARGGLTPSGGAVSLPFGEQGQGRASAGPWGDVGGPFARAPAAGGSLRRAPLLATLPSDDDGLGRAGFAAGEPHQPPPRAGNGTSLRPSPVARGRALERAPQHLPPPQGLTMRPHAPGGREIQGDRSAEAKGEDELGAYSSDDDAAPVPTRQSAGIGAARPGPERPSPIDTQQRRQLAGRQLQDDLMLNGHRAGSNDDDGDDDDDVEVDVDVDGDARQPSQQQPSPTHRTPAASPQSAKIPALAASSGSGDREDDGFGLQELPFAAEAGGDNLGAFPEDDEDGGDSDMDGEPVAGGKPGMRGLSVLESSAPGSMGSTLGSTALTFAKTGAMGGTKMGLSMSGAGFDSTGGSFGDTGSSFGARRRKRGGPSLLVRTGGGMVAPGIIEPAGDADIALKLPGAKYDGGPVALKIAGAASGVDAGGREDDLDDTLASTGIAARRRKRVGGSPSLDLSMSGGLSQKRGLGLSLDTGGNPGAAGGMLDLGDRGTLAVGAPRNAGGAGQGETGRAAAAAEGNLWSTGQSPGGRATGTALDSAFDDGDPFNTPLGDAASGAAQAALGSRVAELSDAGTLRIGGIFEVNAGGILVSNPAAVAAQAVLAAIEGGFDGSDSAETTGEMKTAMERLRNSGHPAWLNAALAKALARAATEEEEGACTEEEGHARGTKGAVACGWGPRSIREELVMMDALGSGASGSVQRALHIPSLRMVAVKSVRVFEAKNRDQMAAELKLLYANITRLPDVAGGSSKPLAADAERSSPSEPVAAAVVVEGGFVRGSAAGSAPAAEAAAAAALASSRGGASSELGMAASESGPLQGAEADGTGSELCPNIVRLYDAYSAKDQGSVCIVMEYMAGGSLQDLVDSGGTQNMVELATIAADTFRGLAFLHSQRQLHRDIKPANILRSNGGGECKLADFGIAKQLEGTMDMAQTWVGTMQYMSPERIDQEGGGYSYPSDVWSLGLSLLAVAAGRFPYTGGQDYFAMMGAVKDEAPPLESLDAHDAAGRRISPEFRDLITRTLAKDPSKRITAVGALNHPFVRMAWKPSAGGGAGNPGGLTLRALAAPKPPWTAAYKPSPEESKRTRDSLVKLLQRVCMKHFKVFARFHARGTDEAAAQKRLLGQRLDDSTFNRHKAERLLVSAGATGDFSYLAGDARTMGFLSRVAHAKALQEAGVGAGLSRTATRRVANLERASKGGRGDRLEASSGPVVRGTAASRVAGGPPLGMGPARRSASSFDAYTSDPMTRHGRQLLMRSLAGKVNAEELGEDGVRAMSRALRAGAARVMEAWGEEGGEDKDGLQGVGGETTAGESSAGKMASASAMESPGSSAVGLTGLAEFGVTASDTVEAVTDKVPEAALRVDEAAVRILADQMGLKPASVAQRLNKVVEAWYRRHRRKQSEKQALAQAARSTLASPVSVRPGVSAKRPPNKRLPVPATGGAPGGDSLRVDQVAGANIVRLGDQDTTIKVMGPSGALTNSVNVAGVETLIRHYGTK